MLAVALALSAVAAFYSIMGLAAIFASAVVPIVVMGTILEVAKLTVTVWLHEYWDRAKWTMKLYLVPAVFVLMVITSMGIFGFLSKAHLDQAVPTGEVAAQVALIDEKIANERDTIANARTLLTQMDKAVTDIGNTPDREVNGRLVSSAERALQVRRSQARDRANLTKTIEEAQVRIVQLQEEKAPVATQLREVEAKVGPIKYIAALIYGDDPDDNLLERAVRYMIILLVAVFDPLAIMMLLAFTESLRWQRESKAALAAAPPTEPAYEPDDGALSDSQLEQIQATAPAPIIQPKEQPHDPDPVDGNDTATDMVGDHPSSHNVPHDTASVPSAELDVPPAPELTTSPDPDLDDDETEERSVIRQAMRLWKQDHPGMTLKEQRRQCALGRLDHEPWLDYLDDPRIVRDVLFGPSLPDDAIKGDMFIKVSDTPHSLHKHNGEKWILVNKNSTDQYAYNDEYIDFLISKISQAQYDPDWLTDIERLRIEDRLRK